MAENAASIQRQTAIKADFLMTKLANATVISMGNGTVRVPLELVDEIGQHLAEQVASCRAIADALDEKTPLRAVK